MPRLVRNFFTGHVSRTALLTALLVGFASFFSSLIIGILLYPGPFDWRKRVLSRAISPDHNPEAYWIPALGIAAAALLFLPFAGYVARRLHGITPQVARWSAWRSCWQHPVHGRGPAVACANAARLGAVA